MEGAGANQSAASSPAAADDRRAGLANLLEKKLAELVELSMRLSTVRSGSLPPAESSDSDEDMSEAEADLAILHTLDM